MRAPCSPRSPRPARAHSTRSDSIPFYNYNYHRPVLNNQNECIGLGRIGPIKNCVLVIRFGWESAGQDRIVFTEPLDSRASAVLTSVHHGSEDKSWCISVPSARRLDLDGGYAIASDVS